MLVSDSVLPCLRLLEEQSDDDLRESLSVLAQSVVRDARRQKIALLGVRGAGKSTVGRKLAERLGYDFIELDHEIEEAADLRLADIFAWHGEGYYRRLEHEVLKTVLKASRPTVIATGGGIVNHSDTYTFLKSMSCSVWLEASAENALVKSGGAGRRASHEKPSSCNGRIASVTHGSNTSVPGS